MQGSSGGVHNKMSDVTARVAVQAQVANFISVGAAAAAAERAEEVWPIVALPDLRRCAAALGVPPGEVDVVVDWLGRDATGEGPWRPSPIALPPDKARDLELFGAHLRCFMSPASSLLGMIFYLSKGKLDALHGPLADRLGRADRPVDRFFLLYRHLAAQDRLVFGPARLLSGAELPRGEGSWLFFDGRFRLTDETRADMLRAAGVRRWSKGLGTAREVAFKVVFSSDPSTVPLLEFEGTVGPHRLTMVLSRRHLWLNSITHWYFSRMVAGRELTLRGFGTLTPDADEIRPIVLEAYGPRTD